MALLDAGLSMRQVSNETGYAVGTVKTIALRNNVSIGRRRKKITKDIERDIWRKAFLGMHRADIAKLHNVSLGAVEQIIQSHKGLSEWRHHLLMCQRKAENRKLLLERMQSQPELTRGELKNTCSSYMWLYKNDKDWLYEHLPPAQSFLYHPSLDWAARDSILAIKMRNMIPPAASLSALDRQLGAHGWLLKYADKLPKTMALAQEKIRQSGNIGSE
ncbi:TnsD family Tn7-like transposition protein [Rheinheimera sp.]|uniref:TnsD family Tn7-like transposition protein n=1 Tax=Rheinheimera sp. TaxID=1869214 RepID=UPI003D2962FB